MTDPWDHQFVSDERNNPLWHTISSPPPVGQIPIFRAHALMLAHAHQHGARFTLVSGDRRDSVIKRFNARYHTNLHGQQYLYDHQHDPGFYPANAPGFSSHELRADGLPIYRSRGKVIARGGPIPNYMLGIDAVDDGSVNDCVHLVLILNQLGYSAVRPYPDGREAHHLIVTSSPVAVLRHWNIVPA
jgi:hypothetical protein